jgi:hypothetical protein
MGHFNDIKLDEKSLEFLAPVEAAFDAAWDALMALPDNDARKASAEQLEVSYFWVEECVRDNQVWRVGQAAQEPT